MICWAHFRLWEKHLELKFFSVYKLEMALKCIDRVMLQQLLFFSSFRNSQARKTYKFVGSKIEGLHLAITKAKRFQNVRERAWETLSIAQMAQQNTLLNQALCEAHNKACCCCGLFLGKYVYYAIWMFSLFVYARMWLCVCMLGCVYGEVGMGVGVGVYLCMCMGLGVCLSISIQIVALPQEAKHKQQASKSGWQQAGGSDKLLPAIISVIHGRPWRIRNFRKLLSLSLCLSCQLSLCEWVPSMANRSVIAIFPLANASSAQAIRISCVKLI